MGRNFYYAIDNDQFAEIREQGRIYVDKTDMVYDIISRYKYIFLSRPRRFGKSLLCNTFKAYFEGRRELFEGLEIECLEKEWKRYPILHFDISNLKNLSVDDARGKLGNLLSEYERIYGSDSEEKTPGNRFRGIIHRAYEQTGERVVILIDEYDSPIMRLLYDREKLDRMRTMLREFYQTLKIEGECIRFVFITGVTKFSHLSIFSELNNLKNISMIPEYSGLCGITKSELETTLRPCVEDFAQRYGCTVEEAYRLLRKQYDGYHFCKGGEDVFSPYSLLNSLNDGEITNYWFTSATSTALVEHLKHYPLNDTMGYDGIQVDLDEFDISCEDAATPIPMLYQSGYLSIDAFDRLMNTYTLHFPNNEVRNGMVKCLMPIILKRTLADSTGLIRGMTGCIYNGDLSGMLLHLRSYIAGIPYDIITKNDWEDRKNRESFYKLLFYMAFSMLNANVDCEHKSILGRSDVVIRTSQDVFVLELKVDGTVEQALTQIENKGYAIQWSADGRRVTKCGAVLNSDCRNLTHWRVTDHSGTVIDEQTFDTVS